MTGKAPPADRLARDLEIELRKAWRDEGVTIHEVQPFGGGHAGFTYLVEIDGGRTTGAFVLRLSPPNARIAGNADIGRQARIIAALGEQGFPVPRVFAASSAAAVDGRSYMLTERAVGDDFSSAALRVPQARLAEMATALIRRLRETGVADTGIGSERPASLPEELARWDGLIVRAPEAVRAEAGALRARLAAELPAERPAVLVHGDFHFGNLLFLEDRVTAVLDWEIAELGHPNVDFGSLAVAAVRRGYGVPNSMGDIEISLARLAALYGVDQGEAAWFAAFGCYKYAAILGYNFALHRSGRRPDPMYEELQETMSRLAVDGARFLREGVGAW